MDKTKVLVVASPGWNAGVVGIVAGKLVEAYGRPAIVIGVNDAETHGKGSARSIPGFDMFQGIQICRDLLESCGGHEMAAGLSLTMEKLSAFEERINTHAAATMTDEDFIPRLAHDGVIDPSDSELEPAGRLGAARTVRAGQPGAALCVREPAESAMPGALGKTCRHLKMRVRAEAMDPTDCIAWGQGDWADRAGPGDTLEAVFTPQINEWNGRRLLQFNIKDLRQSTELTGRRGTRDAHLRPGTRLFLITMLTALTVSCPSWPVPAACAGKRFMSTMRCRQLSLPDWD